MKAQYLSRAFEVQPAFNQDLVGSFGDQAQVALLDCANWAEGEPTIDAGSSTLQHVLNTPRLEQDETDSDILDSLTKGDLTKLEELVDRLKTSYNPSERLSKAYLTAVSSAPEDALKMILGTNMIDLTKKDDINDRNCLHKAAMAGRLYFLDVGLNSGVDPSIPDAYGRIPLHYACMNGHVDLIHDLVAAQPGTIETEDLDGFTPLLHAITHSHFPCVQKLLSSSARVDRIRVGSHIPLNLACQYGSVEIIRLLLDEQAAILPDVEGLFPQHLVARFGRDPQLLPMLRQYGANLDQPDKFLDWTPVFHAANDGRMECLQTLLSLGVNAAAKDEKGLTAQYYATWEGHLECMKLLAAVVEHPPTRQPASGLMPMQAMEFTPTGGDLDGDIDMIPDLALPPPIMPSRKYGHTFLGARTTVLFSLLESTQGSAVQFYNASKYPAARITISPKSTDILPRNIDLPIQDDKRYVSFEMEDLTTFSVDFDVYPTFGRRVIAKGSVPAEVFLTARGSYGYYYLSLFDPRLRSVGQIFFQFHIIRPFSGLPLDITTTATYWKATSQPEPNDRSNRQESQVTISSLSGQYVRLYVQVTRDGIPFMCPYWTMDITPEVKLNAMDAVFAQISDLDIRNHGPDFVARQLASLSSHNLPAIHQSLAVSHASLESVLSSLPVDVHVELHVLYPNAETRDQLRLNAQPPDLNVYLDSILKVVFEHTRSIRKQAGNASRGIVFTSYNKDLCNALNLKQPNCKLESSFDTEAQANHRHSPRPTLQRPRRS